MTPLKCAAVITASFFGIASALPASAQRSLDPAPKESSDILGL
jgi:hypothetical protein